ncbi:ribonuclease [Devosia sp. MC521]|uniref:ribonuclease T2 family protein n=1 Tax=Devosia sp. MC521 TaxID=2759954 RepID=UPI0015FCD598|nr:ribonuclease [Devosia sp. MC521]MBJ6986733.1 ribonuclease [Devosia sp. MC521]QMW61765.1 ribonuclease [Devosia sp. MC521]
MLRRLTTLAFALICAPAYAEVPLSGTFTAAEACPALQSISRETNPGNITTQAGTQYELLAGNRTPPTHVRVRIPGAQPDLRWVSVACGSSPALTGEAPSQPTRNAASAPKQHYILAANWQPAFCETAPRKTECRNQRPNSFEATNFTLHGLWPQPKDAEYCDVSNRDRYASQDGRWRDLPQLDLTIAQRRELDVVMPGSASGLDRHEWIKHGTCYDGNQRDYIDASLFLMQALNDSEVAHLFSESIGRRVAIDQVRATFDASFGRGAGDRVAMDCETDGNRTIITELRIALAGEITSPDDFADLVRAGTPQRHTCRSGHVDAVGLQ